MTLLPTTKYTKSNPFSTKPPSLYTNLPSNGQQQSPKSTTLPLPISFPPLKASPSSIYPSAFPQNQMIAPAFQIKIRTGNDELATLPWTAFAIHAATTYHRQRHQHPHPATRPDRRKPKRNLLPRRHASNVSSRDQSHKYVAPYPRRSQTASPPSLLAT